MRGRRAGIGIEVEEDQVGLRAFAQALQCVADAQSQARVVAQPQMLAGQARNRRAQLDGLGLLQRQVAQAGLGQAAGTETEEQRATRLRMAEPAEQHGAGVVVFQPGRIGHEHAALLDTVAELEEAIVAGLDDPDDPVFVALLDQQTFFAHHSPPRRFAGYRQALRQKHRSIAKPARRWISAIATIAGGAAASCSTMPQSAFPSIAKSRR